MQQRCIVLGGGGRVQGHVSNHTGKVLGAKFSPTSLLHFKTINKQVGQCKLSTTILHIWFQLFYRPSASDRCKFVYTCLQSPLSKLSCSWTLFWHQKLIIMRFFYGTVFCVFLICMDKNESMDCCSYCLCQTHGSNNFRQTNYNWRTFQGLFKDNHGFQGPRFMQLISTLWPPFKHCIALNK